MQYHNCNSLVFRGIPGWFRGGSGVVSCAFRGILGVFRGVPGVFRGVPGTTMVSEYGAHCGARCGVHSGVRNARFSF